MKIQSQSGLFYIIWICFGITALLLFPACDMDTAGIPETALEQHIWEGELSEDTTWSGLIEAGYVTVPEGVTLTIEPDTTVKFRASRDYKNMNKGGLGIEGGTLKAVGTADEQIFFTSDYEGAGFEYPINGDWFGIFLEDTDDSILEYTVVEFAEIGVEQYSASVNISRSVIRWNNTEGLYAEQSSPDFTENTLYQNGYHEIALEQDNENVKIRNNLFQKGYVGVHAENTEVTIEDNYFDRYESHAVTAGMDSNLVIKNNWFYEVTRDPNIMIPNDSTAEKKDNEVDNDGSEKPIFDYSVPDEYVLGYRPATEADEYQYVYDEDDETRKVTRKLGEGSGLGFGWALLYHEGYLWRFSIGTGEHGEGLDFIRIYPETQEVIKMGTDFAVNPRGLAHDGKYFWVNDFSEQKLYKFQAPDQIKEKAKVQYIDGFDIPEHELGGTMGLTFDDTHLLLPSRDQSKLYKIDPDDPESEPETVKLPVRVGNDIAWHNGYFWSAASGKGLGKFEIAGNEAELVGSIYPAAYDAWAITSNGKDGDEARLWTLQKTCELWDDDKLFEIQPKDPKM